jgi:hypothetical protein
MCSLEREWPGIFGEGVAGEPGKEARGDCQRGKERELYCCTAVIHGDLPPNANLSHWCKRTGV